MPHLSVEDLNLLFADARTYNGWASDPVPDATLRELYDLVKLAPTSANSCPARFVFLRTPEAKARLKPHLSPGNVDKAMAAPVVVIVAQDLAFYEQMPQLFPSRPLRDVFANDAALAADTARRNTVLQGAYLILAARALGLDVGPMSGFDPAGVDREFFGERPLRAEFLVNLGRGDPASLWPRNPRLAFEQACELV
jgi:3-hydroxypropanoate dehydrogenase